MTLFMKLKDWIKENKLPAKHVGNFVYEVEGVGKFLHIKPVDGKILDNNLNFILSEKSYNRLNEEEFKGVVFEFGKCYYYSSVKKVKDEYNEEQFKAEFNDFRYLGVLENEYGFSNLGLHTEYELLNSGANIKTAVKKAKFLNQKALAVCDLNSVGSSLAFQLACKGEGIKSIIGMTVSVIYGERIHRCKLYALNKKGWLNLLQINKIINVDNNYEGIQEVDLLKYGEGLVFVFDYEDNILHSKSVIDSKKIIKEYKKCFVKVFMQFSSVAYLDERFDLKILEFYKTYFTHLLDKVKPILIDDIYYINKQENEIRSKLNKIKGVVNPESENQHLKDAEEILDSTVNLFKDTEYCGLDSSDIFGLMLSNVNWIVDNCDFEIDTGNHKLPKFPYWDYRDKHNRKYESSDDMFIDLCTVGLWDKVKPNVNKEKFKEYKDRLAEEIDVITGAGFSDYFLILWDTIKFAKSDGILVGPGRGSVGGSLVAYSLSITELDPIKFDLLFERFLNKTRVSGERAQAADALPDIDVDFESARRDDIKRYLEVKYGINYVCSVGTFGRLKLKGAIKDLGRKKGIDFQLLNTITKDIDNQHEYNFSDLVKYAVNNENLYNFVQKHPDVIEDLKIILNNPKSSSVHPSAVIIVPREDKEGNPVNLFSYLPMKKIDGVLVSEWEGKYTDRGGFLKEDILGISQMDKFKYILDLVYKNKGEKIDLNSVPLDDENTFELFHKGYNEDVFQFGSMGLKSYSRDVLPDSIEDIIAMNALYRPGPMDSGAHKDFALIKHGKKKPQYDYGLKDVTIATSGLYIYQEQIMKAVHVLGKLTLSEADEVRTVMKKFDAKKMLTFEEKFINGAVENGCDEEEAKEIWAKLKAFSGYGFNRSHSAAYALIAYWCQWLKANHPLEFWASAFNFEKVENVSFVMREMNKVSKHIKLGPPDINISTEKFEANPDNDTIYWSFNLIKGLGESATNKILAERKREGKFFSLEDFMARPVGVNKSVVRTLILSGAFDEIYDVVKPRERREILKKFYDIRKEPYYNDEMLISEEMSNKDYFWILVQRRLIGFGDIEYKTLLKGVDKLSKYVSKYVSGKKLQLKTTSVGDRNDTILVSGFLQKITERQSKRGPFGILELENNNEVIDVILWNDSWSTFKTAVEGYSKRMIALTGFAGYDDWRKKNVIYSNNDTKIIEL